ncbi:hypothetical protein BDV98DRAFT_524359 [Pterulicium gracile]|uniref:BTB domain-containing protein n=1 Tax=Pterulicium gracile TaxID=1884261 RepID=A0A5C3QU06_9AGAR|nr:hypothetical protein BDV98DRAFT_524359 [Pterula gracilis]
MFSDAAFVDASPTTSDAEPTRVSNASVSTPSSIRSALFYLETVTFRVEGTLYKVPQQRFKTESAVFRGMYSLPQQADAEGSSDEKPIDLCDVKEVDFVRFLKVVVPLDNNGPTGKYEEWTSVLKLATMWGFKGIRDLAISNMEPLVTDLKATDKIALAYEYSVQTWFLDGFNALVQAKAFASEFESEWIRLGWCMQWVFRLVAEREACCATGGHRPALSANCSHGYSCNRCCTSTTYGYPGQWLSPSSSGSACTVSHHDALKTAFASELKDMKYRNNAWVEDEVDGGKENQGNVKKGGKGKKKLKPVAA